MYKFCAFDLDGTLTDTIADIASAANYGLEQLGLPTHAADEYRFMVGNGMRKICERALPEDKKQLTDELVALYNERYIAHCCENTKLYDGVHDMLLALVRAGVRIAVVTNKPQPQSDAVCAAYLSDVPFLEIVGQSELRPGKPAPDMLEYVLNKYNVRKEDAIYVGDSCVDVRFAKNAGLPVIGVAWGFRGEKELQEEGADFIAQSASQVVQTVTGEKAVR